MRSTSSNDCDVAVIGAGPYGLAATAHLKGAGFAAKVFGEPMSFWRDHMPKGMLLRSPRRATDIADPGGALSLARFAQDRPEARGGHLPVESFVAYGDWFQACAAPDLDRRKVARLEASAGAFRLALDDGSTVRAERVVVAMGLANQQFRPGEFDKLPAQLASHSCEHADLGRFAGRRVAVVGRGQSACESAALLSEAGADVDLVCRGPVHWLGGGDGPSHLRARLKGQVAGLLAAPSAVGPFPYAWLVERPDLVHRLPDGARARFNAKCLGAGAAGWLLPRFGTVRLNSGRPVTRAVPRQDGVELTLAGGPTLSVDHVLLATGYRPDIARLGLFDPDLLARIACRAGSPVLADGLESSVPGLHFAGAAAVASFGPLLRFIAGTGFAARALTRSAMASRGVVRRSGKRFAAEGLAAQSPQL